MKDKKIWYEILHKGFGQYFSIENILFHKKTEYYDLIIFENCRFGRIMALDGIVQTTEYDEFIYHEMMAHLPILAHGAVKTVLIIGGGDGAILREVSRHKSIEKITMVEIDINLVQICKKYLPNHSKGAYEDLRLRLIIDNGINFINQCKEKFDIIISDCTDPIGPGLSLFTSNFYQGCYRCLNKNGIFISQNGVCFLQHKNVVDSYQRLGHYFDDVSFYQAAVPSYYGGIMTFAWASNDPSLRQCDVSIIDSRFVASNLKCRYYNPKIHASSFTLPQYLLNALEE